MAPCGIPASPVTESQDPASKRKRTNRLAKLKQCKREARREQWLFHQETERQQGEGNFHADTDPCINDPGEVIHPEPANTKPLLPTNSTITWASLLNSGISSQMQRRTHSSARVWTPDSEPDPELSETNPTSRVNIRIKRTDQKDWCRDSSPATCDGCGDADASPKSCGDKSPKSKESKVGRGSRRSRGHRRRNSKENECFGNLETRGQHGQVEGKRAHAHGREDGWEAAADALGVHTMEKKDFSNVLQPQALPLNNQQCTRTSSSAPLLGRKPRKHQQSANGRAWMQGDSRRPTCLPSPTKQQSSGVDVPVLTNLNDVLEKPQCLICTEDLDNTDTSFDGCECGFNICLFCYHKIEQETGRCPGCRGVYKRDVTAKPACLLPP